MGPKEAKNIPEVLQSYVTYDTLVGARILLRLGWGGFGRILKGLIRWVTRRICGHFENEPDVFGFGRRRIAAHLRSLPHRATRPRPNAVPEGRCRRCPVRG